MEKYSEYEVVPWNWSHTIPHHWNIAQFRQLFSVVKRIAGAEGYDVLSITQSGIRVKDVKSNQGQIAADYSNYQFVDPGDFAMNHMDLLTGYIGISDRHGVTSPDYRVFKAVSHDILSKYYLYVFQMCYKLKIFYGLGQGVANKGRWRLPAKQLNKFELPLPPLREQQAIVSYLDDKCGKIDQLLENKAKELELLAEMKQRVIADAVTTGLNPDVTMKDSGIPWLPQIPEHWEASKVSSHFRQRNEKVSDKDYPALSVSKQGITPQLENVALSNAEGNSRKLVKIGDYAVNSRSDRKGSCGVSKYEGSVSLITIVLEPRNIDGGYVHYLFRSTPWVEEFYRNGRGIVADLWTTNFQMMKGMYLPFPPIDEQKAIVAHIEEKISKIDALADKLQKEIESIKEYKQRLISDVVTGQIKVLK